jgi:hypothetical protein
MRTRCLWKADQIVASIGAYIRNGGCQDLKKGDFSKIEDALHKLAKLRATALSSAEHESFREKILKSIRAEMCRQKTGTSWEGFNLVSSKDADRLKKLLKAGRRSMDPNNKHWVK